MLRQVRLSLTRPEARQIRADASGGLTKDVDLVGRGGIAGGVVSCSRFFLCQFRSAAVQHFLLYELFLSSRKDCEWVERFSWASSKCPDSLHSASTYRNSTCQQFMQDLHTQHQHMSTTWSASAYTHSTIASSAAHVNNISSICIHAQHHCIINGASQHLTQDLFIVHGNKKFQ